MVRSWRSWETCVCVGKHKWGAGTRSKRRGGEGSVFGWRQRAPLLVCAPLALPAVHFSHWGFCFSLRGTDRCAPPTPSHALSAQLKSKFLRKHSYQTCYSRNSQQILIKSKQWQTKGLKIHQGRTIVVKQLLLNKDVNINKSSNKGSELAKPVVHKQLVKKDNRFLHQNIPTKWSQTHRQEMLGVLAWLIIKYIYVEFQVK